ncbi:MAG: hypothetical protein EZS28_012762 [Streblomastix strix]|uniref:Protein kinase domain-containing protein n=1 Tax=Streblomastix strix TaxID=222440 RepID=A0A5J4WAN2_9EUKA|nr:MAG: hypothetical protein EZS28_012762 [Streblomastix strix]
MQQSSESDGSEPFGQATKKYLSSKHLPPTEELRVVKEVQSSPLQKFLLAGAQKAEKIQCPFLMKRYATLEFDGKFRLVFEFAELGNLNDAIDRNAKIFCNEESIRKITWQMLKVVASIHTSNLVFLDGLRAKHVFIMKDSLASLYSSLQSHPFSKFRISVSGWPLFETEQNGINLRAGKNNDIWSLGVIMLQLIIGKLLPAERYNADAQGDNCSGPPNQENINVLQQVFHQQLHQKDLHLLV